MDGKDEFLVNKMVELCCAAEVSEQFKAGVRQQGLRLAHELVRSQVNRYTTTLHAINSAIIKLSKLTYAGRIYRGIAGMGLPREFWRPNEHGVKGGIEGAFMSTTTQRQVAMSYAAGRGEKGIVFEMQQGMINRGADISFLSQYPHEREMCVPSSCCVHLHNHMDVCGHA